MNTTELYETDFYAWTQRQVELLKEKQFDKIDFENVIEELEVMGRSEKRQFVSRLAQLIAHLMKWQYQQKRRSKSWKYSIRNQRDSIMELLQDSPSLRLEIESKIERAFKKAIGIVLVETDIEEKTLPKTCPYTFDQMMDDNFLPD